MRILVAVLFWAALFVPAAATCITPARNERAIVHVHPMAYQTALLTGRAAKAFVARWNLIPPRTKTLGDLVDIWTRSGSVRLLVIIYWKGCSTLSLEISRRRFKHIWPKVTLGKLAAR